jgi:hypothetical protein
MALDLLTLAPLSAVRLANQSTAFNIDAILLNQFNSMQFNPEFQIT